MENEGAPPVAREDDAAADDVSVVYNGPHPLIRRCGVVLMPGTPLRVSRAIAERLTAAPDCAYVPAP